MSEPNTTWTGAGTLAGDRESATVFALTMLLAGLAAGWAGRSLLAGEALTEQFWLVPVGLGLATSLYAQVRGI